MTPTCIFDSNSGDPIASPPPPSSELWEKHCVLCYNYLNSITPHLTLWPAGNIFHVRVNTPFSNLEHALLYSIGVNLPLHRVGQLDRVIVLASPINDINMHAWDLNQVKRFVELDIGIRVDLCFLCTRTHSPAAFTLILEKRFIKDCISFLCREAHIMDQPVEDNGLLLYTLPHACRSSPPPCQPAPPPPPYSEIEGDGASKFSFPDSSKGKLQAEEDGWGKGICTWVPHYRV